jgi:8-oxo-dGTP diphosphatase
MPDASSPPSRPQLAVSGAIFRHGKILLVRRARAPGHGVYSLPGGRVEFGESLHEALAREVSEETGLAIEIIGLAGWREVLPPAGGGGHYVILSFAARWIAGDVALNEEHDDFKWLPPEGVSGLAHTSGLPEVVEAARRLL